MIQFDANGYMQGVTNLNLEALETHFVAAFPDTSGRRQLFENYLHYTNRFQAEVFPFFEQWIDGSFVTQKAQPKDIDIVTFLDYKVWELRGDKVLDSFWSFALEKEGIDAYLVATYPSEHPNYSVYQSERKLWMERFGSDRSRHRKGFVRINFEA